MVGRRKFLTTVGAMSIAFSGCTNITGSEKGVFTYRNEDLSISEDHTDIATESIEKNHVSGDIRLTSSIGVIATANEFLYSLSAEYSADPQEDRWEHTQFQMIHDWTINGTVRDHMTNMVPANDSQNGSNYQLDIEDRSKSKQGNWRIHQLEPRSSPEFYQFGTEFRASKSSEEASIVEIRTETKFEEDRLFGESTNISARISFSFDDFSSI
ncbi:hypothetical protein [Natronosalvus vescus]|uniref:hypothetical protein n=1 Tax=Natronosalvus vescus TaxID=2953881 RepID=UPI0020915D8A|nr:hypothetical protein [Natronosalvus vescus]